MWTAETRARHNRDHLRYGSDLSDEEWQILASLLPLPAKTGRRWVWPMREMLNAIFYVLRSGCPWRLLPEHFPPHQTTYRWFVRFRDDGLWESLNHHLVMVDRERVSLDSIDLPKYKTQSEVSRQPLRGQGSNTLSFDTPRRDGGVEKA